MIPFRCFIITVLLMVAVSIDPSGAIAQEWHPGLRATCPICRKRAADDVKRRIEADGKDPRTVSTSEVRTYIQQVREGGQYDQELVITPTTLRRYGIAVAAPKPIEPDFTSQDRTLISTLNQNNRDTFAIFELRISGSERAVREYKISSGNDEPLYTGTDMKSLVQSLHEQAGTEGPSTIYVVPRRLTVDKTNAFLASARIQLRQIDPEMQLRSISARADEPLASKPLLSRDARFDIESFSEPAKSTVGRFKGFYSVTAKIVEASRTASLKIYSRSLQTLNSFVEFLRSRLNRDVVGLAPVEIVNKARQDFIKNHAYSEKDLEVTFVDEFGRTDIVELRFLNSQKSAGG